MDNNALTGSFFDSNPVRSNDPAVQFQGTYAAASGMGITHLHTAITKPTNPCTRSSRPRAQASQTLSLQPSMPTRFMPSFQSPPPIKGRPLGPVVTP